MSHLRSVRKRFLTLRSSVVRSIKSANSERLLKRRLARTQIDWRPVADEEPIRLVFLVLTPHVWPSIEPIWRKASQDPRFHTKVVLLENAHVDDGLSGLVAARKVLEDSGVPFIQGRVFSLTRYAPHVVFCPLPYNVLYPDGYQPDDISASRARIAYVPYGLEVGGGAYNAVSQYNSHVAQNAWRVFARSDGQLRSFARHSLNGSANVVVTGHPRTSGLQTNRKDLPEDVLAKANGRKIVLWCPHFSVMSRRTWSSFLENHESIFAEIERRTDLFFVFRPHPLLKRELRQVSGWGAERARSWFTDLAALPNAHIDADADYRPAFNSSAALLTDSGSYLVEYLLTDKPVCHLLSPNAIGLTEEAHQLHAFHSGDSISEINTFLDKVAGGDDRNGEARKHAAEAYFGDIGSDPAENILVEIVKGISDRPFVTGAEAHGEKHNAAFEYWTKAKTTFLAPPDYYNKQEALLTDLLQQLGKIGFVVDVGCGNGRFTEIFAQHAAHVEGVDPGHALIEEARQNAAKKKISNIDYHIERLEQVQLISSYDLVSCMGVLSGLIDNDVFLNAARTLRSATKPGGYLLLKDSLSVGRQQTIRADDYVAVYRNIDDYLSAFTSLGYTLEQEITIAPVNEQGLTNRFFLLHLQD